MTTYRLMDGVSGRPGAGSSGTQPPASSTSYSGSYLAGLGFEVTEYTWLEGFWWYVADSSQSQSAQTFCLWQAYSAADTGILVAGTTVTSGTLSTGWNYVALSTPVPLSPGIPYHAQTGFSNNFPLTQNQFGSGNPYSAGITNGPLFAYSSGSGSAHDPWGNAQMPYSTSTSDPAASFAVLNDENDNLWLDVQVTDAAPSGSTYRGWPTMPEPPGASAQSVSYTLGMEFSVTGPCTLEKIWHYSPPAATLLPTRCGIWVTAAQAELSGSDNSSPSWLLPGGGAAAAGGGWVYCDYSSSGVTLSASTSYKVSTFCNAGSSVWFSATASYWSTGGGSAGFTNGPLTIPDNSAATSPGQNTWNTGTTWTYPDTSTNPESDWIDVEVAPSGAAPGAAAAPLVPPAPFSPMAFTRQAFPSPAPLLAAGADSGSGADAATSAASVAAADTGTAAEAAAGTVSSADTGPGADSGYPVVPVAAADTGAGADSGSVAAAAIAGADTGPGADSAAVTVSATGADSGHGTDSASAYQPAVLPPAAQLGGSAVSSSTYGGSAVNTSTYGGSAE